MTHAETRYQRITQTVRRYSRAVFEIGALSVLAISLISFCGYLSPSIDIYSHFRWQYAACLTVLMLIALLIRAKGTTILLTVGTAINLLTIIFLSIPVAPPATSSLSTSLKGGELTLLNLNLQYGNHDYATVIERIRHTDADVVTCEELTTDMNSLLERALTDYPYRCTEPRDDSSGIGIFSKRKFISSDINPLSLPASLVVRGDVECGGWPISIFAIHACGPTSTAGCNLDRTIANQLAKLQQSQKDKPLILIGDLNSTPWSQIFRQFFTACRFIDSEQGYGLQCSWPTSVPLLLMPLDHCFFTDDFRCIERKLLESVGSDHYPLLLKLKFQPKK